MIDRFFIKDDYKIDFKYVEGIREFALLKDCEQNPKWHSEGNAWEHTKRCVEAAYKLILDDMYDGLDLKIAILSVLFHDIGKISTTNFIKGNWHAYGHEFESERMARRILWDEPLSIREIVCACARYHMKVLRLAESKNIVNEMISMSRMLFCNWRYLLFVKHCDILGSTPDDAVQTFRDVNAIYSIYDVAKSLGILDGKFHVRTSLADKFVFRHICGKEPKSTVYVLIGLPGAGKNTYAETRLLSHDVEMVSRDDIRAELGYCNDGDKVVLSKEQEEEVTKAFNDKVLALVAAGDDVCLNNLNIKKRYRDAYKQLLQKYPVRWEYIYVEAPTIEDNVRRRPTFEPGVIESMMEVLEWPQPEEYDEIIISKQ